MSAAEEVTFEVVERTPSSLAALVANPKTHILVALAAGCGLGGAATYYYIKDKLEKKYDEISRTEISEAKSYYSMLNKTGEYSDPIELAKALEEEEALKTEADLSEGLGYRTTHPAMAPEVLEVPGHLKYHGKVEKPAESEEELVETPPVVHNVFKDAKSANSYFDYDEELKKRSPDVPYIISQAEFFENEDDCFTQALTYYEGDDVLADERELPVPDAEAAIGDTSLLRFGHGSKDPNVVYMRNEKLNVIFEVTRHEGEFADEVLDLKHSDSSSRNRKFRRYDE